MITLDAYWKGRNIEYADELTPETIDNASATVATANQLLLHAGFDWMVEVNSGWRPQAVNDRTANAAVGSKHLTAQAIDIADKDNELDDWCMNNLSVLVALGLWLEHPGWTPGWCHLQIVPPRNVYAVRVFVPSTRPPTLMKWGASPVIVA